MNEKEELLTNFRKMNELTKEIDNSITILTQTLKEKDKEITELKLKHEAFRRKNLDYLKQIDELKHELLNEGAKENHEQKRL